MQYSRLWCAILLSALAGCGYEEPIGHYRVARVATADAPVQKAAPSARQGMLAAIVPHADQGWFFKIMGPVETLAGQSEAFHAFVESLSFVDDRPHYQVPHNWQAKGRSGMRYETFEIPAAGGSLELTVTTLPKTPGSDEAYILSNVNRWRGQVGLEPIDETRLAESCLPMPLADGTKATMVVLVGKGAAGSAMGGAVPGNAAGGNAEARPAASGDRATANPARPAQARPQAPDTPEKGGLQAAMVFHGDRAWFFKLTGSADQTRELADAFRKFVESVRFVDDKPTYDTPAGWQAQGGAGMRFEAFKIDGFENPQPELTIITLAKPPGDETRYILDNLNRWLNQMQLSPVDAAHLDEHIDRVKTADGSPAIVIRGIEN